MKIKLIQKWKIDKEWEIIKVIKKLEKEIVFKKLNFKKKL